jgi:hypothetical protein
VGSRAVSIIRIAVSRTMGPMAGPTDIPSSYSPLVNSDPGKM